MLMSTPARGVRLKLRGAVEYDASTYHFRAPAAFHALAGIADLLSGLAATVRFVALCTSRAGSSRFNWVRAETILAT